MNIPSALLLAAAAAALASCKTPASSDESTGIERFRKVDANKDGRLSYVECYDRFVTIYFDARDKNRDRILTWEEWNVPGSKADKAKFAARDGNKDGKVSFEEAIAHGRRHGVHKETLLEADSNKDGSITFEEAEAYYGSKEGPVN